MKVPQANTEIDRLEGVRSAPELNTLYKRVMALLNAKLGKNLIIVPVLKAEVPHAEQVAWMWRDLGWPAQFNGEAIVFDFRKNGGKPIKKKWWQFWKR